MLLLFVCIMQRMHHVSCASCIPHALYASFIVCFIHCMHHVLCSLYNICIMHHMNPAFYASCIVCNMHHVHHASCASCIICIMYRMHHALYASYATFLLIISLYYPYLTSGYGPTDRPTDIATYRAAIAAKNILQL